MEFEVVLLLPLNISDELNRLNDLREEIENQFQAQLTIEFTDTVTKPHCLYRSESDTVPSIDLMRNLYTTVSNYVAIVPLDRSVRTRQFKNMLGGRLFIRDSVFSNGRSGIDVDNMGIVDIRNSNFNNNKVFDIKMNGIGHVNLSGNNIRSTNMSDKETPAFDIESGSADVEDTLYIGDRPPFKVRTKEHLSFKRNHAFASNASPELVKAVNDLRLAMSDILDPSTKELGEMMVKHFEEARAAGETGEMHLIRLQNWAIQAGVLLSSGAIIYSFIVAVAKAVGVELPPAPAGLGQ